MCEIVRDHNHISHQVIGFSIALLTGMVHFMERRRTPTQSPRQRAREKAKRKNRKNIFAYFRELFTLKYDLWIKSDVIKFLMHKQLI